MGEVTKQILPAMAETVQSQAPNAWSFLSFAVIAFIVTAAVVYIVKMILASNSESSKTNNTRIETPLNAIDEKIKTLFVNLREVKDSITDMRKELTEQLQHSEAGLKSYCKDLIDAHALHVQQQNKR